MHFLEVADTFEAIEAHSSRTMITKCLAELFAKASPEEGRIIAYLCMGLLRAPYEGTHINLAEKSVAKVLASMVGMTASEVVAKAREIGDLGSLLRLFPRSAVHQHSVVQVYDSLCALEKMIGEGSQEEKATALEQFLLSLDSLSACFCIRIIMGTLRLGFSDMTIIDALSWMMAGNKSLHVDIEDAYNRCADLGLIAKVAIQEGMQGLRSIAITPGIPIRPAAAERLPTAQDIIKKLGPCLVQPKIDGFRLQIHIDRSTLPARIWFYSRNLQDMSAMFPDLVHAFLSLPVTSLIVEGEAIVYDAETESFVPFQETAKRKRKHDIEAVASQLPLRLFLFDILYLNGVSTLEKTHTQRRELLQSLFSLPYADDAVVTVIDEHMVNTAKALEDDFLKAVQDGLEGLVVKRPDAMYQPGKRNFNWIKLKRQEEGHLDDTIDAVILGYYKGRGKRSSFGIGAFLVGVYDKTHDRFETIAKIGTGLKDDDWRALKKVCDQHMVHECPHNVVCDKTLRPDVWVAPEVVCMIRADEITLSPVHSAGKTATHAGYALRFPRIMGYRPDKNATQATEIAEIKTLFAQQR